MGNGTLRQFMPFWPAALHQSRAGGPGGTALAEKDGRVRSASVTADGKSDAGESGGGEGGGEGCSGGCASEGCCSEGIP